MASIRKEFLIASRAEEVWDAVRDFGALHRRLVPGFVVDAKMDGDARIVTFANGMVAREVLVDLDDKAKRLVYAIVGGRPTHYNASVQVLSEGEASARFIWIIDVLPNDLAPAIDAMAEQGAKAIKRTLEGNSPAAYERSAQAS
jgi:hypothetical protein